MFGEEASGCRKWHMCTGPEVGGDSSTRHLQRGWYGWHPGSENLRSMRYTATLADTWDSCNPDFIRIAEEISIRKGGWMVREKQQWEYRTYSASVWGHILGCWKQVRLEGLWGLPWVHWDSVRSIQGNVRLIMREGNEMCRAGQNLFTAVVAADRSQTLHPLAGLPFVFTLQSVFPHSHCSVKLSISSPNTLYLHIAQLSSAWTSRHREYFPNEI